MLEQKRKIAWDAAYANANNFKIAKKKLVKAQTLSFLWPFDFSPWEFFKRAYLWHEGN